MLRAPHPALAPCRGRGVASPHCVLQLGGVIVYSVLCGFGAKRGYHFAKTFDLPVSALWV